MSKDNVALVLEELKADKKLAANTNNKSSNLKKKVKEVLNNLD